MSAEAGQLQIGLVPWWGWTLFVVILTIFLIVLGLNWRSQLKRNPDRHTIRREPVVFRYSPIGACQVREGGKRQVGPLRGMELLVHGDAVQLSYVVPGIWLLAPEWYRNSADVRMESVEGVPLPPWLRENRICLEVAETTYVFGHRGHGTSRDGVRLRLIVRRQRVAIGHQLSFDDVGGVSKIGGSTSRVLLDCCLPTNFEGTTAGGAGRFYGRCSPFAWLSGLASAVLAPFAILGMTSEPAHDDPLRLRLRRC